MNHQPTTDRNASNQAVKPRFLFTAYCLLLTAHSALFQPETWACPLCREALFAPQETHATRRLAQGYALSITTLLGTPLLLVGGIAGLLITATRRTRRR